MRADSGDRRMAPAGDHSVIAGGCDEVVATAKMDQVSTAASVDRGVPLARRYDGVIAAASGDRVVARARPDEIVAIASVDRVVAATKRPNDVVAIAGVDRPVAIIGLRHKDGCGAATADHRAGPSGRDEAEFADARQYQLVGIAGAEDHGFIGGVDDSLVPGMQRRRTVFCRDEFAGLAGGQRRRSRPARAGWCLSARPP